MKLTIERHTAWDNKFEEVVNYEPTNAKITEVFSNVEKYFSRFPSLKFGRGGNHIWFSNLDNERIAILYFN